MNKQLNDRFLDTEAEIYPMPSFVRLGVTNLERSLEWYRDTLGFSTIFSMPGASGNLIMAHVRWARYADMMLVPRRSSSDYQANPDLTIYFTVERGQTDILAQRAGDSIVEGPVLRSWNTKELVVRDPDGNLLTFAEQGDPSLDFNTVMDRTRDAKGKE